VDVASSSNTTATNKTNKSFIDSMLELSHHLMKPTRALSQAIRAHPATSYRPQNYSIHIPHQIRLQKRAMSDSTNSANQHTPQDPQNETPQDTSKTPLPLPAPTGEEGTTQINVGGQAVKLDHLGPLVVNKDGTLSRIANWEQMADIEKQNTLRILVKRNQLRTETLKEKAEGEGKGV
jgi:hypothetical protein